MLDKLYANIGGKIKNWAKWIFIVEAIGAVIAGFVIWEEAWLALLIIAFGPIVAWVSSWILYAFGEMAEDIHAMRNKVCSETAKAAKREGQSQSSAGKAYRKTEEKTQYHKKAEPKEEHETEIYDYSDSDFIDVTCPKCGEQLSFFKNEVNGICPECGTQFKIK